MSIEFIDGEPPEATGTNIRWGPIADKLEANPGSWAIVDLARTGAKLRTISYNMNHHTDSCAERVRYGFESCVRADRLYMRYIGRYGAGWGDGRIIKGAR